MAEARRGAPVEPGGRPLWLILAVWIIPALAVMLGLGLWFTAATLRELSDSAYDRSLAGAIRAIDLNVSTESGGVGVELPYPLFESLQATATGNVFFRVSTDDGLVEIGDALLPEPPPLEPGEMRFFDATFFDQPIRAGAYLRAAPDLIAGEERRIVIEVAETTGSREAFRREVIGRALWRDVAVVSAAALLIGIGMHRALRPLRILRERLDRRTADDLRRLEAGGLPREVRPLVGAVNGLIDRHHAEAEAQRRFIDDASHQLKTPIAVLRSQIDYMARTPDPAARDGALAAMRDVTIRMARVVTQLLSLARARSGAVEIAPVDVSHLLSEAARLHLAEARRRRIMLEIDMADGPLFVAGSEVLLFEAVSNLIDNALRAVGRGGEVMLRAQPAGRNVLIAVEDTGPGMEEEAIRLAGERFRNAPARAMDLQAGVTGSGLGLSIVLAIVRAQGGTFRLRNRATGGLAATIRLRRIPGLKAN